jgi:hypothetical protein
LAEHVLPADFREFLKLLTEAEVEYLLIGGYAVGYHGYPRTTADMDVWVAISPANAAKLVGVFHRFGMRDPKLIRRARADCFGRSEGQYDLPGALAEKQARIRPPQGSRRS